jgi:hypothetical protein
MIRKSSPRGVTTATYMQRQHLQAGFAVIPSGILHHDGRFPFEPLYEIKAQTALRDVLRALFAVERKGDIFKCDSRNCPATRLSAVAKTSRGRRR